MPQNCGHKLPIYLTQFWQSGHGWVFFVLFGLRNELGYL